LQPITAYGTCHEIFHAVRNYSDKKECEPFEDAIQLHLNFVMTLGTFSLDGRIEFPNCLVTPAE